MIKIIYPLKHSLLKRVEKYERLVLRKATNSKSSFTFFLLHLKNILLYKNLLI